MAETKLDDAAGTQATEEFMGSVLADYGGFTTTLMSAIGERYGLFRALADEPATSAELAGRTGTNERYVREWLHALTASGYLSHDRDDGRYAIPPENAPVLAEEGGPFFFGGGFQMALGFLPAVDAVAAAFKNGGGASQSQYGPDLWPGMARFTAGWFDNLLLQDWIPAVPEVQEKLERGCSLADVGCGAGDALIVLAREFPRSRFVGYDVFDGQLELARRNVAEAGLADRVELQHADVADGLPERYDVITTFDVIHDAADPAGLVRAARDGLTDDGVYLMLEMKCADDPADNVGPVAEFMYGASVFYCMTTSLAAGGAGLGTCGMPESRVREFGHAAGFGTVRVAPIEDNPFNVLYELRP